MGMRGGQPSITQPIAGPWLSPQVVTRKRWPKLLWDIFERPAPLGGRCQAVLGTESTKVKPPAPRPFRFAPRRAPPSLRCVGRGFALAADPCLISIACGRPA